MITLIALFLAGSPASPASALPGAAPLAELFRRTDEYRQCLILDLTLGRRERDSFFAEGGTSAENLDLMLSDRQDRLLKRLIEQGKSGEIVEALRTVRFTQVDSEQCRDFDPYFGKAFEQLEVLERSVGIENGWYRVRSRPQHSSR